MEGEGRELRRLIVFWVAVQTAGWCNVTSDCWRWIQAPGNSCNYLQSVRIWRQRWKLASICTVIKTNRDQHWFLSVYHMVYTLICLENEYNMRWTHMLHVFHMLLENSFMCRKSHFLKVIWWESWWEPSTVSRNVSGIHFSYLPCALNSSCRSQCLSEAEVSFLLSGFVWDHSLTSLLSKATVKDLLLVVAF